MRKQTIKKSINEDIILIIVYVSLIFRAHYKFNIQMKITRTNMKYRPHESKIDVQTKLYYYFEGLNQAHGNKSSGGFKWKYPF